MNEYKSEDARVGDEIIVEAVGGALLSGRQRGWLEKEVICRRKNASMQNGNGRRAVHHCRYHAGLISVLFMCVSDSLDVILQKIKKSSEATDLTKNFNHL